VERQVSSVAPLGKHESSLRTAADGAAAVAGFDVGLNGDLLHGFLRGSVAADEIAAAGLDVGLDLHGELLRAAADDAVAGFDVGLDGDLLHESSVDQLPPMR
jgi:hypothetical protein